MHRLRALLLILMLCLSFNVATQEDAGAAYCTPRIVSAYKSGNMVYATGSFTCSGMSGVGRICATGYGGNNFCSNYISVPSGGTRSIKVVSEQGLCVGQTRYSKVVASISGSTATTYVRVC